MRVQHKIGARRIGLLALATVAALVGSVLTPALSAAAPRDIEAGGAVEAGTSSSGIAGLGWPSVSGPDRQ